MAQRTITHFKVGAALFNDITALLFELPAKASRELLNRIENSPECEPMFKLEFTPARRGKPEKQKVRKPPPRKNKARKKVAKRKRRS